MIRFYFKDFSNQVSEKSAGAFFPRIGDTIVMKTNKGVVVEVILNYDTDSVDILFS